MSVGTRSFAMAGGELPRLVSILLLGSLAADRVLIHSAMFMNSNSLPIALMQSLVIEVPGLKVSPPSASHLCSLVAVFTLLGFISGATTMTTKACSVAPSPTSSCTAHLA